MASSLRSTIAGSLGAWFTRLRARLLGRSTRLNPRTRFGLESLGLLVFAVAFIVLSHQMQWFGAFDRLLYDSVIKRVAVPLNPDIVIVAIDDDSLNRHGRWPWPRELQADLYQRLAAYRPRVVAADIIYANAGDPATDQTLIDALAGIRVLALPVIIDQVAQGRQHIEVLPFAQLLPSADLLGHVQIERDPDTLVRGVNLHQGVGSPFWPHLMLRVRDYLSGVESTPCVSEAPARHLGTVSCGYTRIPFTGPRGTFPQVSATQLLSGNDSGPEANLSAALEDRIVLLGVTALGGGDLITSPLGGDDGPLSGVEFNANLLNALLGERTIASVPAAASLTLAMLIAALVCLLLPRLTAKQALAYALLIALAPALLTIALLAGAAAHMPLANASVATLLIYPLWSWRRHEIAWAFISEELDRIDDEERSWRSRNVFSREGVAAMVHAETGTQARDRVAQLLQAAGVAEASPDHSVHPPARALIEATAAVGAARIDGVPAERLARQITRLQTRAEALRNGRDIGLAGLGRMSSGALILSAFGTILYANAAAARMLMLPDAIDMLAVLDRIRPPLGQSWPDIWRTVVLEQQHVGFESQYTSNDNGTATTHPVYVAIEPLPTDSPASYAPYWVVTLSDLTEIRTAQAQREEALAFLSHDIRSPLTSVLALLQQADASTPMLDNIAQYTKKALAASDQFLQLSRLQLQAQFETYPLEMEQVVHNAVEQVFFIAREKQITLHIEVDASVPDEGLWLDGNGELLERAFINLLGNAIKYSDSGTHITASIRQTDDRVEIEFADQGHGIPAAELPHIFEPFFRSSARNLAQNRGAGLGLRFVKSVIERHGGRVSVVSERGHGTTFTVSLPVPDMDAPDMDAPDEDTPDDDMSSSFR